MRGVHSCWILFSLALIGACEPPPSSSAATVIEDSAGVVLVDHGPLEYEQLLLWQMAIDPLVRIGVVEGAPEYQWSEIFAAGRLTDGTIVGLDRDARQVRAFNPTGTHLWTAGQQGQGPGEFRFPWALWVLPNDSIVVSDPGNARVTFLSGSGDYVRDFPLRFPEGAAVAFGPTGDGGIVVAMRKPIMTELEGYSALIMQSHVEVRDASGALDQQLGTHEASRQYDIVGGPEGSFGLALFGASAVLAGSSRGVWHSLATSYEIRVLGSGGTPTRVVRWSGPDRTIAAADLQRLRRVVRDRIAGSPQRAAAVERYLADQPVADLMPAIEKLLVTESGQLWVQDYDRPDYPGADVGWLLLSDDGEQVLGRLSHKPDFTIMAVGSDWVLGTFIDELDVEYLDLRALSPPAS